MSLIVSSFSNGSSGPRPITSSIQFLHQKGAVVLGQGDGHLVQRFGRKGRDFGLEVVFRRVFQSRKVSVSSRRLCSSSFSSIRRCLRLASLSAATASAGVRAGIAGATGRTVAVLA